MRACTTSAPALHCEKQSCLAFPNVTPRAKISKKSFAQRATQHSADTAPKPRRTQLLTPLAFAIPCTQIYFENTGIRTLPYFQTCTLSHACHTKRNLWAEPPHDWAIQSWATSWWLYHLTELFNCELPLVYSTTWLSWSSVGYLLMTLPLDWAIQLWATWLLKRRQTSSSKAASVNCFLLYHLTELVNCELPLDDSTIWLSYSIVSYLSITLPLDWAIQLFVTTEVSN